MTFVSRLLHNASRLLRLVPSLENALKLKDDDSFALSSEQKNVPFGDGSKSLCERSERKFFSIMPFLSLENASCGKNSEFN